ncbi:MAG: fibronectin type III domain-containing protein [Patescibacteria group bacterium]|nr:fibronectin type III domain-containing protein [Patescibacteria group bacterium]
MKNIKKIIIILILVLAGVLAVVGLNAARTYLGGAAGGSEPKSVRVQADVKSATISWESDKESQGVIEYGTTPASLLLRALEASETASHRVLLSPLKTNATYYFRIRVGETVYDNNGIPYSFKTKEDDSVSETGSSGGTDTGGAKVTQVPVQVVTPAAEAATGKITKCDLAEFKKNFGGSNPKYDLDDSGTVNTKDWIKCLEKYGQ